MKVWYNKGFTGHYPVGTAAVMVADTAEEATQALNDSLVQGGLRGDAKVEDTVQLKTLRPSVVILNDGEY